MPVEAARLGAVPVVAGRQWFDGSLQVMGSEERPRGLAQGLTGREEGPGSRHDRRGSSVGRVFEAHDLCAADDASQGQNPLGHGHLDGLDEALAAHHAVATRERLHARLGTHAHHAFFLLTGG